MIGVGKGDGTLLQLSRRGENPIGVGNGEKNGVGGRREGRWEKST